VATLYRSAPEDGMTDLVLLAESFTFNWATANLVQLTARRPPPSAYAKPLSEAQPAFYSDRVALAAGLSTTATWLAFERHDELGWWSLAGDVALTSAVAAGEVMKRDHFMTDVLTACWLEAASVCWCPGLTKAKYGWCLRARGSRSAGRWY
jgi:hypothetical protein